MPSVIKILIFRRSNKGGKCKQNNIVPYPLFYFSAVYI